MLLKGSELKKVIEAALFMAPSVLTIDELSQIAHRNVAEVRVALNDLIHDYENRDSALRIFEDEKGFRMGIVKAVEENVGHLAGVPEFSKGIMKTLAYVAYKQPVKQSEVVKLRNTKAYDHIPVLVAKGFITRERMGSTYLLRTTKKFIEYFGHLGAKGKEMERQMQQALKQRQAAENANVQEIG